MSTQSQPTRVENRPKNAYRLFFFPGPLIYQAIQSLFHITRHHSHDFIHQTPQPRFHSPDSTAIHQSPVSYYQTPQPRFHIIRNQSQDFISPSATAKASFARQHSHVFIHQISKPLFHITRRHSHGIIHVTVSFMSWYHSPDATVRVSFIRHHSHGFIHQIRQPRFLSPDATVTASFTSKRPRVL